MLHFNTQPGLLTNNAILGFPARSRTPPCESNAVLSHLRYEERCRELGHEFSIGNGGSAGDKTSTLDHKVELVLVWS